MGNSIDSSRRAADILAKLSPPAPERLQNAPTPPAPPGRDNIHLVKGKGRDRFAAGAQTPESAASAIMGTLQMRDTAPNANAFSAAKVVAESDLSIMDKLKLTAHLVSDGGEPLRTAVNALGSVPEETRNTLLASMAKDPGGYATLSTAKVLSSPGYLNAPADQQAKIADLCAKADPADLPAIVELVSNPQMMAAKDSQGGTLVDSLDTIANQPLNAAINNTDNKGLLHSVLDESLHPKTEIGQSDYGTCTVTSCQYALASKQPAEYARLVAGLSSQAGTVTMAGGANLDLQTEYYGSHLKGDDRSPSESMFQNAAMDYGNGDVPYDASKDQNQTPGGDSTTWASGLSTNGQSQVAAQLFNTPYVTNNMNTPDQASAALDKLKALDDANLSQPIIVDVRLGPDGDPGYHAMEYQKTENGMVYFRNPWGPGNYMPVEGMTCVDPQNGIYAMTEAEFKDRAYAMSVPVTKDQWSSLGTGVGEHSGSASASAPASAAASAVPDAGQDPSNPASFLARQIAAQRENLRWASIGS